MDNHSHLLVYDDCETCHYVTNAFTLLRLPLTRVTITNLIHDPATLLHATSLIVCKNIENGYIKQIKEIVSDKRIVLISFNDPTITKKHIQHGVCFLKMPFSKYELKDALSHIHRDAKIEAERNFNDKVFERLIGQSDQMTKIKRMIQQVADSDTTVLLLGQSGTGKDVIASCIHQLSSRSDKPLVPINCGAIPSELMESELFGHEKGAFTGASSRRQGRFEMANQGTLFLDEIGDMPLPMQVKLLRVLQERKIDRVGGTTSIDVDVRLIAATNQNLESLIQKHQFREDLFYRLNVVPISLPKLCERAEDIPLIVDFLTEKIYLRLHHKVSFTKRAMDILCHYSWPGNIRELSNFIERMVVLHRDCVLDEKDLDAKYKQKLCPFPLTPIMGETPFNIKEHIAKIEQQLIKVALEQSNGIINVAADYLSLGRTTLIEKMRKYNLSEAN